MTKTLDLLSQCNDCKNSCCRHDRFIITTDEHDTILASGAPDHCVQVDIPLGRFYVLDYKSGPCAYLGKKNTCTIHDVKPSVCRTFPRQSYDGVLRNASWCPIISEGRLKGNKLFEEFLNEASKEVTARLSVITKDVYFGVMDAYNDRFNDYSLKKMNATITYPATQPS